ncbi:MAG: ATP-binding protein [Lachnospiraceae bacterium]|nr:ATP-binding protein [Lachnospiraceae bacterium]
MIGRESEIQELERLYESDNSEFVAVYGRRRVGKTFLIDETFANRITFRHVGLSPIEMQKQPPVRPLKQQLQAFYNLRANTRDFSHEIQPFLHIYFTNYYNIS